MNIKRIYATGKAKVRVGFAAEIETVFGLVRTSEVKSIDITKKGILAITKNSKYEIIRISTFGRKVCFTESICFVAVGKPAIIACEDKLLRTSNVIKTMEDQYGYYLFTKNTIYVLKGAA